MEKKKIKMIILEMKKKNDVDDEKNDNAKDDNKK